LPQCFNIVTAQPDFEERVREIEIHACSYLNNVIYPNLIDLMNMAIAVNVLKIRLLGSDSAQRW
jgi:hypothetical protein